MTQFTNKKITHFYHINYNQIMAEVINMPLLSDTMEEGTIAKWLKKKGDQVEEGDILAEIETDKATMEFESFYEGTVLHIAVEEGDSAPVNNMIAIIGEKGEDIADLIANGGNSSSEDKTQESDKNDDTKEDKKEEESSDNDTADGSEIPDDVEIITMPLLSDTMEEGTIATWLKKEGDNVEEGDILAEIETDKATMEFESFYEGVLLKALLDEGDSAPIDEPIAIIGPKGTDVDAVLNSLKSGGGSAKKKTTDKASSDKAEDTKEETTSSDDKGDKQDTTSSNEGGRIFASPLAKRMAEDKGINLSEVKGSGENGRIIKRDIENFTPSAQATSSKAQSKESESASPVAATYVPVGEETFEEVKNSQMRKTIAKRLTASQFGAPHFYLTIEVDMENAMASRKVINAIPDTKISFNDMVIKASAMALRKHPQVNSIWDDQVTKLAKHINIGVAVAVEDGLVVPVLRFTDQQSMTQIGANVKNLAKKAQNKKIQPDEMEGSTFTVSNLGMFGIQEFTSIINQPNSAILSVGAIQEKPVVKNGEIVVGHTMKLTLACDHRTVDGATGAKFLQTLRTYLENPVTMLA